MILKVTFIKYVKKYFFIKKWFFITFFIDYEFFMLILYIYLKKVSQISTCIFNVFAAVVYGLDRL